MPLKRLADPEFDPCILRESTRAQDRVVKVVCLMIAAESECRNLQAALAQSPCLHARAPVSTSMVHSRQAAIR